MACVANFSCRREPTWQIKGTIAGSGDELLLLEASFNGNWYVLDSTRLKNDGKFVFKEEAPAFPTIYRLTLNNQSAYFPIDSIETVNLEASLSGFQHDYKVTGTKSAELFTQVNELMAVAGLGAGNNDSLKHKLAEMVLIEPDGNAAYYIINRHTPDGKAIFDPSDRRDIRVIGAVANAYNEKRPRDPRTAYLKNLYLSSKFANREIDPAMADSILVQEIDFIEIELLDENGKVRKLSDVTGKAPVILSFTAYTSDFSPALNLELGKLYDKYSQQGLQIYQIGYDNDEFQWRQSAKNIPWVTVFNSAKDGTKYLSQYNVGVLPTFFIFDKNGSLVERVDDPSQISKAIEKYF